MPALVAICRDPEVPRWTMVPSPYGEADARAWLQRCAAEPAQGIGVTLAVVDARRGERLHGSVGLAAIHWAARAADVSYMLGPAARGRGLATRAVRLLAGWAFAALELERLEIRALAGNRASQAVAARAGFERVERPVVQRPELDHLPDIYFAQLRG